MICISTVSHSYILPFTPLVLHSSQWSLTLSGMFLFQALSLHSSKADSANSLSFYSNDTLWVKLSQSKIISLPQIVIFLCHAVFYFSSWLLIHISDTRYFYFLDYFLPSLLEISSRRQVFSFCSLLYPQQMKHMISFVSWNEKNYVKTMILHSIHSTQKYLLDRCGAAMRGLF